MKPWVSVGRLLNVILCSFIALCVPKLDQHSKVGSISKPKTTLLKVMGLLHCIWPEDCSSNWICICSSASLMQNSETNVMSSPFIFKAVLLLYILFGGGEFCLKSKTFFPASMLSGGMLSWNFPCDNSSYATRGDCHRHQQFGEVVSWSMHCQFLMQKFALSMKGECPLHFPLVHRLLAV